MITVSDTPTKITAFDGKYDEDSVEMQVLKQMADSTENYRFSNLGRLEFELSLRRAIVNAAAALNRSGLGFAVFHKSECNTEYWDRTGNGGFRLKEGTNPSDAIRDIYENGQKYATECATAMVIVYYGALLEIFTEEVFNERFSSVYLMNWHELTPLLREIGNPRNVADVLLGDRCYFKNPEVSPKKPELQGENVIVLPDKLYYGHGMGIKTADRIIRVLNANRKEDAAQSAYFMENYAARPNFKKLSEVAQNVSASSSSVLHWRPFPVPVLGRSGI